MKSNIIINIIRKKDFYNSIVYVYTNQCHAYEFDVGSEPEQSPYRMRCL